MKKYSKTILKIFLLIILVSGLFHGILKADTAGNAGDSASNIPKETKTVTSNVDIVPLKNPLSNRFNSVGGLINGLMEIFSYIAVIIAVLALIWVGFQFILARGNSEKISELKTWFYYIVIGTAIILASRLIVSVVINTLEATGAVSQDVIQKVREPLNNK